MPDAPVLVLVDLKRMDALEQSRIITELELAQLRIKIERRLQALEGSLKI